MALLILALPSGLYFLVLDSDNSPQGVVSGVIKSNKEKPKPPPPQIDQTRLSTEINAVIAENPQLDIGVSIKDLKTNATYTYGVEEIFIAASIGKLLTASYYLNQVEQGKYTLDKRIGGQPARVQLQKMLEKSDNNAWHALNNLLTKPALQAYAAEKGLKNYSSETNTITASDVSLLLSDIYQHKLLNETNTALVLNSMKNSSEQIHFIRKYIDPAVAVYHKAGWLKDRAHDTAIVENPKRAYTLVIFTKARFGNYDFQKGQLIFSRLTQVTDNVFTAVSASS